MADSSDAPDWFGNFLMAYILNMIVGVLSGLHSMLIFLNWFGSNDIWAAIALGMAADFLPPLAKENAALTGEFENVGKPFWA